MNITTPPEVPRGRVMRSSLWNDQFQGLFYQQAPSTLLVSPLTRGESPLEGAQAIGVASHNPQLFGISLRYLGIYSVGSGRSAAARDNAARVSKGLPCTLGGVGVPEPTAPRSGTRPGPHSRPI